MAQIRSEFFKEQRQDATGSEGIRPECSKAAAPSSVFTAHPGWRRRGIGLALLQHSFGALRRAGKQTVSLEVDTENPTGATRLYEKAGMHVERRTEILEKELRPGE